MEYIWYIIAALGAGIGTGLAGLFGHHFGTMGCPADMYCCCDYSILLNYWPVISGIDHNIKVFVGDSL